jgi:malate permease and related proteins
MGIFKAAFGETFLAILVIFIIIVTAGLMVRRRIVTQDQIQSLTRVTVNIFLPCLIFSKIVKTFDPGALPIWWVLPLSSVLIACAGLLLGYLVFFRGVAAKKNMLAMCSLHNAGYLILPIGAVLYQDQFDEFALYVFLFIPIFSLILWSYGKYLSTSGETERINLRALITPPFLACVVSLALVFLQVSQYFNDRDHYILYGILRAMDLLGEATVPLANFILGAVLGSISLRIRPYLADAVRVVGVKLFVIPLLALLVLRFTGWFSDNALLCDFFILQAASPPATGLILQVRNYGGDVQKVSSLMLVCYSLCVLTLPFWLALWHSI